MKGIDTIKEWVGALTELALMLLALAIVLSLLVGSNLPFFGAVTANIMIILFPHPALGTQIRRRQ